MSEIALDPELLADFIVESRELIDEFNANLIELENRPEDAGIIGAIFRAAHTLKGSSAFFNLTHVKNFAHKLENLLDDLRHGRRSVTPEAISVLLTGGGHLQAMFDRISVGDYATGMTAGESEFLGVLSAMLEEGAVVVTPEQLLQSINNLTRNFRTGTTTAEETVLKIESLIADSFLTAAAKTQAEAAEQPGGPEQEKIYRYQGVDLTGPFSQAVGLMTEAQNSGQLDVSAYDQALIGLEELVAEHALADLEATLAETASDFRAIRDSALDFDPLLISMMSDKLKEVLDRVEILAPEPPAAESPAGPQAEAPQEAPPPEKEAAKHKEERTERKTMRIDEDKVDGFMNYVGELIVTAESFNYLQKMIENEKVNPVTVRAFKNANQAFRELSGELQESLMEIRRVPIKGLLQKVNLMTRDLSQQIGKKVKAKLTGQDVQLDKSIAENLEGPLVHVVRNSLDHGIELPEVRIEAGKPPEGILEVSASADKEYFYLDVIDDGQGINPDKMRRAAVEKGMMSEGQAGALSDYEAVNLIFKAGFSTAKEITDVSGRGVGMDVVRNNINQLNGSIGLESKPGQGTSIHLKIPLSVTLQVVKALLVRVGRHQFIISLDAILESLRPTPGDLATVEGRGEIINRRGQILPLIRLYKILNIKPEKTNPTDSILVVVETGRGRHALMVDEVLGQQQVVVKELDAQFKNLSFIAGSATLGDGRLGLVLETEGLVKLAQGKH